MVHGGTGGVGGGVTTTEPSPTTAEKSGYKPVRELRGRGRSPRTTPYDRTPSRSPSPPPTPQIWPVIPPRRMPTIAQSPAIMPQLNMEESPILDEEFIVPNSPDAVDSSVQFDTPTENESPVKIPTTVQFKVQKIEEAKKPVLKPTVDKKSKPVVLAPRDKPRYETRWQKQQAEKDRKDMAEFDAVEQLTIPEQAPDPEPAPAASSGASSSTAPRALTRVKAMALPPGPIVFKDKCEKTERQPTGETPEAKREKDDHHGLLVGMDWYHFLHSRLEIDKDKYNEMMISRAMIETDDIDDGMIDSMAPSMHAKSAKGHELPVSKIPVEQQELWQAAMTKEWSSWVRLGAVVK